MVQEFLRKLYETSPARLGMIIGWLLVILLYFLKDSLPAIKRMLRKLW